MAKDLIAALTSVSCFIPESFNFLVLGSCHSASGDVFASSVTFAGWTGLAENWWVLSFLPVAREKFLNFAFCKNC